MTRRDFIGAGVAFAAVCGHAGRVTLPKGTNLAAWGHAALPKPNEIRAVSLHMGMNRMASWTDCKNEGAFRFNCAGMDQLADALES